MTGMARRPSSSLTALLVASLALGLGDHVGALGETSSVENVVVTFSGSNATAVKLVKDAFDNATLGSPAFRREVINGGGLHGNTMNVTVYDSRPGFNPGKTTPDPKHPTGNTANVSLDLSDIQKYATKLGLTPTNFTQLVLKHEINHTEGSKHPPPGRTNISAAAQAENIVALELGIPFERKNDCYPPDPPDPGKWKTDYNISGGVIVITFDPASGAIDPYVGCVEEPMDFAGDVGPAPGPHPPGDALWGEAAATLPGCPGLGARFSVSGGSTDGEDWQFVVARLSTSGPPACLTTSRQAFAGAWDASEGGCLAGPSAGWILCLGPFPTRGLLTTADFSQCNPFGGCTTDGAVTGIRP